ncbi:uncharacterized protein TNCV_1017141 [Trichonephila clavipes]|uniref:Uncharacterized protein n=1 Tax=Trichonephila clavipes TaxID=2585209 RepID=A0A8X6VY18_TRICX|nr:uncharacterized protein TNCV_1017141 [Trichonephila clavipes]
MQKKFITYPCPKFKEWFIAKLPFDIDTYPEIYEDFFFGSGDPSVSRYLYILAAAVAEWYRYRTVACFVTGSSPVPLKTRRVGQRCTLNLSRAETSSRWCGVVVRRGGASSGVVHVT